MSSKRIKRTSTLKLPRFPLNNMLKACEVSKLLVFQLSVTREKFIRTLKLKMNLKGHRETSFAIYNFQQVLRIGLQPKLTIMARSQSNVSQNVKSWILPAKGFQMKVKEFQLLTGFLLVHAYTCTVMCWTNLTTKQWKQF